MNQSLFVGSLLGIKVNAAASHTKNWKPTTYLPEMLLKAQKFDR